MRMDDELEKLLKCPPANSPALLHYWESRDHDCWQVLSIVDCTERLHNHIKSWVDLMVDRQLWYSLLESIDEDC